jgi:thioredoxin reductase (NADPH)
MFIHKITAPAGWAAVLLIAAFSSISSNSASAFMVQKPLTRHQQPPHPQSTKPTTTSLNMEEMQVIECDVAIIGGGPAGCTCAVYTSRADLSTVIIDKNPAVGALAITSHIANYPGVDRSMAGSLLLDQMRFQATQYGARYEKQQVFMIDVDESSTGDSVYTKTVYTPDYTIKARSLVLATGAMGRAAPPFPGEAEFLGQGVSYCATCDGAFYRDSEVCVFGATAEAMEEALFLTKFAKTVHWITSVDVQATQAALANSKIEVNKIMDEELIKDLLGCDNVQHWNKYRMVSVEGDMSGVTGVTVKAVGQSDPEVIPVEGAFIYGAGGGSKPISDFVQNKVDLDESGGAIVNEDMETSVKGIFAIGDIRNTAYKQVVVAASDGCIAAMSIEKFLTGRKTVKVDWVHK